MSWLLFIDACWTLQYFLKRSLYSYSVIGLSIGVPDCYWLSMWRLTVVVWFQVSITALIKRPKNAFLWVIRLAIISKFYKTVENDKAESGSKFGLFIRLHFMKLVLNIVILCFFQIIVHESVNIEYFLFFFLTVSTLLSFTVNEYRDILHKLNKTSWWHSNQCNKRLFKVQKYSNIVNAFF